MHARTTDDEQGNAAAAGWVSRPLLRGSTGPLYALLLLQGLLIIPELAWGVHLHGHAGFITDMPKRMSGVLVQPNSLGIFAVVALAYIQCFASPEAARRGLPITVLLVLMSGSATGAVVLGVYLLLRLARGGASPWQRAGLLLAIGVAVGVLYLIDLNRMDLFSSPLARIGTLEQLIHGMDGRELLFGLAVGAGTNSAFAVSLDHLADPERVRFITDSTLTALIAQLGVSGMLAFYGLLIWAAWRLPVAFPFLVLVALTSLMLNVTELFPVSLLLGLVLAAAIGDRGNSPGRDVSPPRLTPP